MTDIFVQWQHQYLNIMSKNSLFNYFTMDTVVKYKSVNTKNTSSI